MKHVSGKPSFFSCPGMGKNTIFGETQAVFLLHIKKPGAMAPGFSEGLRKLLFVFFLLFLISLEQLILDI